jgi:fatty-acyl-CoA synthase
LAKRLGLLNPATVATTGAAALYWGPGTAAAYAAAAARSPRRVAVIDDYGQLTYLELEWRCSRVAAALRHRGVRAGDAVGLLCRNHRGFVESNVALAKLGARVVYLNPGLPSSQLQEVIEREAVRLVIADRERADDLDHSDIVIAAPEGDTEWTFPGLPSWRPLLQLPRPTASDDPVVLTSGTTGAPKGTRRTTSRATAAAALGVLERIPFERGQTIVLPAPLFHAWGLSQLIASATLGSTVVLRRRFDPELVTADVEAHGATVMVVVPVMLHRILAADTSFDMSTLRIVASSGSAMPGDLAARWIEQYGANLYNLYGSTEVGQVSIATPDDLLIDPATAGRPAPGVDVRIVDDKGDDVAAGAVGNIVVKSGMHFDGYTDGGTKDMFDDYMSIGDQGRIDEAGRLFVIGRADDMIISGGENLYPSNIERALMRDPRVTEAAVVGVDDDDLGQRVRAVVAVDDTAAVSSLKSSLKRTIAADLASHEMPREYVFVDELPRNATGKILRRKLSGPENSIPNRRSKR